MVGRLLALLVVVGATGCSLPVAPCDIAIAATDDPGLQRLPPDAEILVAAADVDPAGWAVTDDAFGNPAVEFRLKPAATERLAAHTAADVGGFLAIAIDDVVVSTPQINGAIDEGLVTISGGSLPTDDIVTTFAPCLPIEIRPPT